MLKVFRVSRLGGSDDETNATQILHSVKTTLRFNTLTNQFATRAARLVAVVVGCTTTLEKIININIVICT